MRLHEPGKCPHEDYRECDGVGRWALDPFALEIHEEENWAYRCDGELAMLSDEI